MKNFWILCALLFTIGACSSNEKVEMDKGETMAKDAQAAGDKMKKEGKAAKADAEKAVSSASRAECTLDKDTRVIEVKKTEGGGCELFYTKFGDAKSVASSGFGSQYCDEVRDRIQSNLEKAGFACK